MATPTLKIVKPATAAERTTHTTLDTIEVTPSMVKGWRIPGFQRALRVNPKVLEVAERIRRDEVIPGVLTLGVLTEKGERNVYIIDGQHRCHAFILACEDRERDGRKEKGITSAYVDVRQRHFESMLDMGDEFVETNGQLVKMRPDDILRGMEGSLPAMRKLRLRCPFVGYDMIRRGEKAPILSMSTLLRCWVGSASEVPSLTVASAASLARSFSNDDAEQLIGFLDLALQAWGRDEQYVRLWNSLSLALTLWLYRRTVLTAHSQRTIRLTREEFGKCMMSMSADSAFVDWLLGRKMSGRDLSPCYARIRAAFVVRIESETGKKPMLPSPVWAHTGGNTTTKAVKRLRAGE
jgi:hypothetical protein